MILSIITICYNNAEGLRQTLASVAAQTSKDFEHVVVDGASTDGSADVIRKYAQSAEYPVVWVSEPDKGIYNAINKGMRMSSGDYIQVLNSGDIYASEYAVERMMKALLDKGEPEFLYGNMIRRCQDGAVGGKSGEVEYSLRQYYQATMNHDCCWIHRSLFEKYGYYDESLRIVSDWKWFLSAIGLGEVHPVYVDIDVTIFDLTGISERNLKLRNEERRRVLEELVPPAILADYDKHAFEMLQMDRLKKHHCYGLVYFVERVFFKLEKWNILKK